MHTRHLLGPDRVTTLAAVVVLLATASAAVAQKRACSEDAASIYERVSVGVVFIEGSSINPYRATDRVEHVVGSGFIVDTSGVILTNSHVALGRQALSVTLDDGTTVPARLIAADPIFDIAVIQIPTPDKGKLPTLTLGDSSSIRTGEDVLVIGNPLGLSQTLTHGIVSAVDRVLPVTFFSQMEPMIQVDSAINHGNSGGPLLNRCGEVIGMTTAVVANSQGIGLAIPINLIKQVLPALGRDHRLIRPWLGFHGQFVDDDLKGLLNLPLTTGFMVEVIEPGSPADTAAMQGGRLEITIAGHDFLIGGDIVTAINGRKLATPEDAMAAVSGLTVGGEVSMTLFREGKSVDVKYTLPERPLLPGDISSGDAGEMLPTIGRTRFRPAGFRF
jgi:S1-C subfamily serine protease